MATRASRARTRALAEFKAGKCRVLVATDIAARGIDIDQLPHVVNFDMPNVPEDYVHRIGRTGRAGATGEAVSLVCVDEKQFLADIERLIKQQIPTQVIAGFVPDPHARPEPILQRSQGRGGQRSGANGGGGRHNEARRGGNGGAAPRPKAKPAGTQVRRDDASIVKAGNGTTRGAPPARARTVNGNTFATTPPPALHRSGGRGR
jgi:ATP-dependent RNA helicase RhlE